MCQLLGMNCSEPTDATFSFTGFARRGGDTDEHADGFGAAFLEGRCWRVFVDSAPCCSSPLADWIKRHPIKTKNVIAHIRKATRGSVSLENTHPFARELWGRHFVFAHNGTLADFSPALNGSYLPLGQTDSELAFCWILQELKARFESSPSTEKLFEALGELTALLARLGRFNFLFSGGDFIIAHCSDRLHYVERAWPFSSARLVDADLSIDFSARATLSDRVAVIATAPLTRDERWISFEPREMALFQNGARVRSAILPEAPKD